MHHSTKGLRSRRYSPPQFGQAQRSAIIDLREVMPMKKLLVLAGLVLGTVTLASPASARNYDCTKAGNANKAACKAPVARASATAKTTRSAVTTRTAASAPLSALHYDCSKPGNKTKADCRSAATPAAAVVTKTTTTTASYDCTKFYNHMRAVCRAQSAANKTSTPSVPARPSMSNPVATRTRTTTTTSRSVNSDAAGATAQCKDGSYSHAQHHSGACSQHGGVARFF